MSGGDRGKAFRSARVSSGHYLSPNRCPLYPRKRTLSDTTGMSALCQKRTHAPQQNGASYSSHFQARQIGTSCTESVKPRSSLTLWIHPSFAFSFDHLVGALLEKPRHVEAERLSGLEIDDQLRSGRSLDRQFAYLGALEDSTDVSCRVLVKVGQIGAVGHQPADLGNTVKRLIVGGRVFSAHSTICERCPLMSGEERTTMPWTRSRMARSKASLKSSGRWTDSDCSVTPAARAADSVARNWTPPTVESQRTAKRESVGTASLSSSICLPPSSGRSRNIPVRLPPGRARLLAHLFATGSLSRSSPTIGIVVVALIAASIA